MGDIGQAARDLACDEGLAAARGLMVEENAVACVQAVGFPIIHGDPVGIHLRNRVRRTRVEGRCLFLRRLLDEAVKLRGRGLVEACLLCQSEKTNGFQKTKRADRVDIGGVLRRFEGDSHMDWAPRLKLRPAERPGECGSGRRIAQITIVQLELALPACGSS